jgi:SAM-dependent methyltransferase
VGTDLSWPMLRAASERAERAEREGEAVRGRVAWVLAPMDALPFAHEAFDLVIAHGVWNLARSDEELRRAVAEAARVARPGAAAFVFTFSRSTLPPEARPVSGESFVFTQFSGRPQAFLTEDQLLGEMREAGFEPERAVPLTEYNRPEPGTIRPGTPPVIFEAAFRRKGRGA